MPVEDALILISRNFEGYMRGDKVGSQATGANSALLERHPEGFQASKNVSS